MSSLLFDKSLGTKIGSPFVFTEQILSRLIEYVASVYNLVGKNVGILGDLCLHGMY
jgi:hypothetical protein